MSGLRDLYQELILDHTKHPRNCCRLEAPCCTAKGYNPLCGDRITIYLQLEGDRLQNISFEGSGCAISTASASMMTESLKGKSKEEVIALFEKFHRLVTRGIDESPDLSGLGKLEVFAGVREFPVRIKCATLAWHTLKAALEKRETVSTE